MANKKKSTVEEKEKKSVSTKKEVKREKVEETKIESPIKTGMSETTRGMIIGIVITALIASIIILLILGKNDDNKATKWGSNSNTVSNSNASEMEKFNEYFKRKEPTLIVFAQDGCGWCGYQEPIVKRIGEMYNMDYLFMDITKLQSQAELNEVVEKLEIGDGGTPTPVIVKDGKVVSTYGGMGEGKEYVEFLVDGGVLPKDSTYKDEENLIRIKYDKVVELVKGKETSVILFDLYASNVAVCGQTCLDQRVILNDIAKENNIPIYHYHANDMDSKFIDKLGDWGYSTDDYKDKKSIGLPLLMFVKDGKLVWYQNGNMKEEDIRKEFKNYGLIK